MLGAKSFTPKGSQLLPRTTAELQPLIANDHNHIVVEIAGSNAEWLPVGVWVAAWY